MDWIKGKHHFSFGAENIIGQMYQSNVYDSNGYFNFNGSGAQAIPLATSLLGRCTSLRTQASK